MLLKAVGMILLISNTPYPIGYEISIRVLPIIGIRAINKNFMTNILMLRPEFLPGYLPKVFSEMSFEDCKILEHPDHQVSGIKSALKLLIYGEKNTASPFLER